MTEKYKKLLDRSYRDIDGVLAQAERKLAKAYRDSYAEVQAKIAKLYATIGSPPSIQEARRYNRLAKLQLDISAEYTKLTGKSIAIISRAETDVFTEAAYRTQWALDMSTGVQIKFGKLPVAAIEASVYSDVSGLVFSKRMRDNSRQAVSNLTATLTRSLINGEPFATTARSLKDVFQSGYSDAVRVVRTEGTRNMTAGHLWSFEAAQEAGVKMRKQWVATLDDRTRDRHQDLDGQFADDDGLFHIGGYSAEGPGLFGDPAMDIQCRCTVVEVIDGLEPELRREQGGNVIEYQRYENWINDR